MDRYDTPHRRTQKLATDLNRFTRPCPHQLHNFGNGSTGMGGPRLPAGPILDFALASSKGHVRANEEREGSEESCGEVVAGVDEERGY